MGTKVKGIFKGLKYISQIFDEPKKEPAFQIGLPTDVKHVAHIGWDNGPAVDSPSWMKGFESTEGGGHHPAPSSVEDSSKRIVHKASNSLVDSRVTDPPKKEQLRTSSPVTDSPKKEKSKSSRRRHSKSSSGSIKLNQDENVVSDSPVRDLPDIPRKCRRKKSKDSSSSRSSKHRSLASGSDPESLKSHSTKENESSQAG